MLRTRVASGLTMIAALFSILVWDARWAPYYPILAVAIAAVAGLGAWEVARLLQQLPLAVKTWFCVAGSVGTILANWIPRVLGDVAGPDITAATIAFVVFGMTSLVLAAWEYEAPGDSVAKAAGQLFCIFYVGLLGSFVVQVRWFGETPAGGAVAFALTIFTAKFCDIGAYFAGKAFGRTKMSPRLSPGKTWEGFAGGVALAVGLAISLALLGKYLAGEEVLTPIQAVVFGLIIGGVGPVGDLVESLIKRDSRQKDASANIPGFGGMLDVVDSVLYAGPVAYLLFAWMT